MSLYHYIFIKGRKRMKNEGKKSYQSPDVQIVLLDCRDVLTVSRDMGDWV